MPAYFYGGFKEKNYIMVEEVFVILLTTFPFCYCFFVGYFWPPEHIM